MAQAKARKAKPKKKGLHLPPEELKKALAMPKEKRARKGLAYIKSRRGNW